jgi:putative heme iron utilization protein
VEEEGPRRRFLERHEAARFYAEFKDFSFWRIEPRGAHLVAGFGRIVDLKPEDLLVPVEGAEGLAAAEAEAVAHVNEDHRETLDLYATKLLGRRPGAWRVTGIDPEGCDLALEDETARLLFADLVKTPGDLRKAFRTLADAARAGS